MYGIPPVDDVSFQHASVWRVLLSSVQEKQRGRWLPRVPRSIAAGGARCKLLRAAAEMDGVAMQRARESLDIVHTMSNLLGAGLDRQTLAIVVALCEHGVNPEALAAVVKELRREAAAVAEKTGH